MICFKNYLLLPLILILLVVQSLSFYLYSKGVATTNNLAPSYQLRINSGGDEVVVENKLFEKDQFFTGNGKSFTNSQIEDIKNTSSDDIYLSERSTQTFRGSFGYDIPVPNGTYHITLHFAEVYWGATGGGLGGTGKRVFSVSMEGVSVISDFDIYEEVGAMTALTKTFKVEVLDGNLNLEFKGKVDQPKLSALEIVSESLRLDNPLLKINSGGEATNSLETSFESDIYFEGAGKSFVNDAVASSFQNGSIYTSERSTLSNRGSFSYAIPVTEGTYQIRLHFAEIYWGATGGGAGGTGKRVFDVSLEGDKVLENYDIYKEAGPMTPIIEEFETTVNDGFLNITFSGIVDQPKVSAIEIFGTGSIDTIKKDSCEWTSLASGSLEKVECQSAKIDGKLYTLAGFLKGLVITGVTEIYDPNTNSWSTGAPMPLPVTHMGKAVVGKNIWIIAGFAGNHPGVATDKVQIYNTVTDTWSEGPAIPAPTGSGAAAFLNGKIHFFGGLKPDRVTDVGAHYVLDINNIDQGWTTAAPLPNPRNHHSAASLNGLVYAIGGQYGHDNGVDDQRFLHAYNPQTDSWSSKANLPSDRSHFEPGTIVHNEKIIIAGGRRGSFFFDDITQYDPKTNQWTELCKLPGKLLAPVAEVFGNRLIITNGGENGERFPLDNARYIPIEPDTRAFDDFVVNLEAENAKLTGCVPDRSHAGFSGSGFVDFVQSSSESIEWTITDVPKNGSYFVFIRYALETGDRPLQLLVNGETVSNTLSFPATGAWNTWQSVEQEVYLNQGLNKIKVQSIGNSGANLDAIAISKIAALGKQLYVNQKNPVTLHSAKDNIGLVLTPNPAENLLTFQLPLKNNNPIAVTIISLDGRQQKTFSFQGSKDVYKDVIDIQFLSKGAYIFKITTAQHTTTSLFIKK